MVCDAAMIVSTLVSFMMNGVCCVYQMQEEEDRRQTLRKDIRVEYERQRLMDLERWAELRSKELHYQCESSLKDDRRQRLLSRKLDLSSHVKREGQLQEREDAASESDRSESSDKAVFFSETQCSYVDISRGTLKQSRSVPPSKSSFAQRRLAQKLTAQVAASDMSSLLDSDTEEQFFDDMADDDSSLVDVSLY